MSAWVVEREHVDVMVRYGMNDATWRNSVGGWERLTRDKATEVGRMLMEENVASVCARYPNDSADMYEDALNYEYRDPHYVMSAQEALKTVACFEYQSCEHDEWEDSEAFRFCAAIRSIAMDALGAGPWGWDRDSLKAARASVAVA